MSPQAEKPTIILATSNGVGMGHLARASAIALELKEIANPIIVSMAGGVAEVPNFVGVRCEYIPGRDRGWMPRKLWDAYLRDRLLALIEETDAQVLSFDGVVPYPGVIGAKLKKNDLALVWVRRGLWQKKPQGLALGLQSMMMDVIIEPGDFARVYDHGPTKNRKDAVVTSAVSLYQESTALDRDEARIALGIDLNRPAVLVQLGTGDSDVNEKMTAALKGLIGWKDLQVVLTKKPIDANGISLVPEGLEIKQVRYFPLAKVLHAFDAAICATGYNGVHELLPALAVGQEAFGAVVQFHEAAGQGGQAGGDAAAVEVADGIPFPWGSAGAFQGVVQRARRIAGHGADFAGARRGADDHGRL